MKYGNIISFLTEQPLYSTPEQARTIRDIIEDAEAGQIASRRKEFEKWAEENDVDMSTGSGRVRINGRTAVVPIKGFISKRMNLMSMMSGGTSTEMLQKTVDKLAERDDVETVVLDVDSNGGSVRGVEMATRAVRSLRGKKRVVAVANDRMNSAAYYIGSAADNIYVTPSSTVGSIGVVQMITEKSEKLKDEGVKVHVIRRGEYKARANGAEPIAKKYLKEYEAGVEKYYQDFVSAVAANRNISFDQAKEMADGRTHEGEQAVEAGLADGAKTLQEVLDEIEAEENASDALVVAKEEISDLHARLETVQGEKEAAESRVSDLEDQLEAFEKATKASEVEQIVTAAVDEGRIPQAKAQKYTDMGLEFGADHVEDILADFPAGNAVPVDEEIEVEEDEPNADPDDFTPRTEAEKHVYSQFSNLREKYDL